MKSESFINSQSNAAGYFNLSGGLEGDLPVMPALKHKLPLKNGLIMSDRPFTRIRNYDICVIGDILSALSSSFSLADYNNNPEALAALLYDEKGPSFCSLLEGFFLILFYDRRNDEFYIFNNRYQAAGVYYWLDDKRFVFARSLTSLINMLPDNPVFDKKSIPSFLNTGFSCTEKTQFKNIFRLLPSYRINAKNKKISFSHHWHGEFKFDRKPFKDVKGKLDEYEGLFSASVKNFLRKTCPEKLGCFLSGGHDTSFVFIQAAKLFKKPIHTFTASFRNFGFDESPKAKYLTDKFGGIHHKVIVENKHLDLIPQMVRIIEEPVPGGAFPIFVCCLEASKHVDTILTGDGGDSLWGEYYPVAEWHRYLKHLPFLARKLARNLNKFVLKFNDWERLWESEHVFSLFAKKNMYEDFFNRLSSYRHFNDEFLRRILNPAIFDDIGINKCMLKIKFTRDNFYDALIEAKMFYGLYQYMLPPTQKPIEFSGVNFFAPYLNSEIINFINSLPEDWLNGGNTFRKLTNDAHKRRFHKMALLRYLPRRYVYSAQQSLDVPFHSFLNLRPAILNNLLKRLKKRGWFNNDTLDDLFDEFKNQKAKPQEIIELKHHGYRIFCLLTLEVWCMEFLDKDTKDKKEAGDNIPLEDYLSL